MEKIYLKSFLIFIFISACSSKPSDEKHTSNNKEFTNEQFNKYWYNNDAEITSFQLEQARYGEIHSGKAIMIFVTEPFSKEKQVKVDHPSPKDENVLKLNFIKNFNTGIYPYSMMTSSFLPLSDLTLPVEKVTSSVQEWCGHVYTQINKKKKKWKVNSYSYFESEGDQHFELDLYTLEDELWSKIKTNPDLLPIGKHQIIPSLFYLRLMHQPLKPYQAEIKKTVKNNFVEYTISYPELDRKLIIHFHSQFPYLIEGWEESYKSGWGENATYLTTKAKKIKTIKTPYWEKNTVIDSALRDSLELEK